MICKYLLMLGVAGLLCMRCISGGDDQQVQGGSGSEIVGNVQDGNGALPKRTAMASSFKPFPYAKIYLYTNRTTPDTNWTHTPLTPIILADLNGHFRIKNVNQGSYIVEATDDNDSKSASVAVDVTSDDSVYDIGTLVLHLNGKLELTIPSLPIPVSVPYLVSIPGTRIVVKGTTSSGQVIHIDNIPAGIHTVHVEVYTFKADIHDVDIEEGVTKALGVISFNR